MTKIIKNLIGKLINFGLEHVWGVLVDARCQMSFGHIIYYVLSTLHNLLPRYF